MFDQNNSFHLVFKPTIIHRFKILQTVNPIEIKLTSLKKLQIKTIIKKSSPSHHPLLSIHQLTTHNSLTRSPSTERARERAPQLSFGFVSGKRSGRAKEANLGLPQVSRRLAYGRFGSVLPSSRLTSACVCAFLTSLRLLRWGWWWVVKRPLAAALRANLVLVWCGD